MKRYALKGINDEETVCSVCGRVELKKVMWLVELDADGNEAGDAFHCGTTCGARLMGKKVSQVNKVVNSFDSALWRAREKAERAHPASQKAANILAELNELQRREGFRYATRRDHPLMAQYRELIAEARAAAEQQVQFVEID